MVKRKANTRALTYNTYTHSISNDNKLLWRVEWCLPNAEPALSQPNSRQQPAQDQQAQQQPFRLVEAMHDEGKPLLPALLRHLEPRTVCDIWLWLIE